MYPDGTIVAREQTTSLTRVAHEVHANHGYKYCGFRTPTFGWNHFAVPMRERRR